MALVTVNVAGEPSLAEALAGVTVPLAQDTLTVTLAALLGTKSLRTSNVSVTVGGVQSAAAYAFFGLEGPLFS